MPKKQTSRKERERLQRRSEIIGIALKLFSEHGFHNVSMQQIAESSEFAVGTLYNFFENKEALFEELVNNTGQQVLKEFLEILNGPGNEKELLSNFINHQPEFLEKHYCVLKLYFSEIGAKSLKYSKIHDVHDIHTTIDSKLTEIIKKGIKKGFFRKVDPEIAAKSLGALIETLTVDITVKYKKEDIIKKFQKVEQLFLEGLLLPKE